MASKAAERELNRRREAKENGIVLERKAAKAPRKRSHNIAIDRPGIGKFRGGMLKLGKRDARSLGGRK
jgi:hypothetical protein